MLPAESRIAVNDVELCLFEWPGEGPPIVLVHATGFHARCWDQVVAHLPGRHVYAVDMRGHGRSSKPEPPYPWSLFGDDLAALAGALALRGATGVGHSMGGHSVVLAAANTPAAFANLLLVDPVITSKAAYATARPNSDGHFSSRRRNEWASAGEMFERFKDRAPFNGWEPAVLRDYCEYGLVPAADGNGFVLACPPAIEAAIYAGASGTDAYPAIESLQIPVRVLRARQRPEGGGASPADMGGSPTVPDLATHFRRAEDVFLPEYSHFIPMEAPAFVAGQILEIAGSS
jgi:pimeloyl-ACP methyl ester carboxylesterase